MFIYFIFLNLLLFIYKSFKKSLGSNFRFGRLNKIGLNERKRPKLFFFYTFSFYNLKFEVKLNK